MTDLFLLAQHSVVPSFFNWSFIILHNWRPTRRIQ